MDTLSNSGNIDCVNNGDARGRMQLFFRAIAVPATALLLGAAAPNALNEMANGRTSANRHVGKAQRVTVPPLVRTQSVDPPDPGCKSGQEDRSSDLCAQWKAADAAERAATAADRAVILGERQFWAGIAGAVFGLFALLAAIQATRYAGRAHSLTQNVNNAYLGVQGVYSEYMIENGVKELRFITRYKNYGPTPARDVETWEFGPCFRTELPTEPVVAFGKEPYHTFDKMVPGSDARATHGVAVTDEQFLAMARGELRLFLPFHLRYKTIFTDDIRTVLSEVEVVLFTKPGAEDKPLARYLTHRYETT